jgi:alpha-tubulin suppressor-like RCC1 family protein
VPVFTRLVAGGGHTCGLTAAGEMHCWGANSYGQAGRLP